MVKLKRNTSSKLLLISRQLRLLSLLGWSMVLSIATVTAQQISSATIEGGSNSNRLIVNFSESITVSDGGAGFRLVGGVARIDKLLSGSGSSTLTFSLTDHALPDDRFTLLHWPEMSDARGPSGKLATPDESVSVNSSGVKSYQGSGTLYYVSNSEGNDSGSDRGSRDKPFKTVVAAQNMATPGDFILLKRGDVWDRTNVVITKSGTANNYLTIGAYGNGNKPVIYSKGLSLNYGTQRHRVTGATFAVHGANYVQVDNLHVKTDKSSGESNDGIQLLDCKYAVVSNCIAEAPGPGGFFGIRVNTWVDTDPIPGVTKEESLFNNTYPQVLNCEVFGYQANMGTQIWPYDGRHAILEGGLIENCISRDPKNPALGGNVWENIMINRGEFNGFVIRKNKVYNYFISGIETFGSKNVVIEYNEVYDPLDFDRGGLGIKAGGYNDASQTAPGVGELFSENIIIRYNKVYNITQGDDKDVNAIDGSNTRSGKIYGNLVYNVRDIGIKVTGRLNQEGWDVYNNTVLNCGINAIQLYTDGAYAANVRIKNNIVQGGIHDINGIVRGTSQKAVGSNNILINNTTAGAYQSTTDLQATLSDLFVNPSQNDYRLKENAPAINAGTSDIPSYMRDIQGYLINEAPDIGAYEYNGQTGDLDPEEPTDPEPPVSAENGVRYAYYKDVSENWSALPDFASLSPDKEGVLANFSLSPAEQADFYGFVYTTYLEVEQAGEYTFYLLSDDGSQLLIEGQEVVSYDGRHSATEEQSGKIMLSKGRHKLEVRYFEYRFSQSLQVSYQGPGVSKQVIPDGVLFLEDDGTSDPVNIWLEAECASSVGSAWQLKQDSKASGGEYTVYRGSKSLEAAPTASSAALVYQVNIAQAGNYYLLARLQAPDAAANSVWVKIDEGAWIKWWEEITLGSSFNWNLAPGGAVSLSQGEHTLRVAYREPNTQVDKLLLSTEKTLPEGTGPQASNCNTTNLNENGVAYRYYKDQTENWSALPDFASLSADKEGVLANFSLSPAEQADHYGFVYTTYLEVDQAGEYTFYLLSDDGSRLFVEGQEVVSYDGRHSASEEQSGKVVLSKGRHRLEVRYFEYRFSQSLQVSYAGPGISKQAIPDQVLFLESSSARQASWAKSGKASLESESDKLQVYPNPADTEIRIAVGSVQEPVQVVLTDLSGRVVYRAEMKQATVLSVPTAVLPEGVYLLRMQQVQRIFTRKVIVQH